MVLPRIEQLYFSQYSLGLSVSSAQAYLSAVASGMMALMSIVFAMAFVMVQFSAIAYSPRLVVWLANDRSLFHSLGVFSATFMYALVTLAWIDRSASGSVPLLSAIIVGILLIISMLMFSRLVQRLSDLQITNVLAMIGDKGRNAISEMEKSGKDDTPAKGNRPHIESVDQGHVTQTLHYSGAPRTIARVEHQSLVQLAKQAKGFLELNCAVGDTLANGTLLVTVYSADRLLDENMVLRNIHLQSERTFEQDPRYPIRLLVDIAIKALSPAINDPTTAVQAIDQIEDLLRRVGECRLGAGLEKDEKGVVRVVYPTATWEDYLSLSFDEIRHYGADSVQVMRRLQAALLGMTASLSDEKRVEAVKAYVAHLNKTIDSSTLDRTDRAKAHEQDRQGLGLSRTTS